MCGIGGLLARGGLWVGDRFELECARSGRRCADIANILFTNNYQIFSGGKTHYLMDQDVRLASEPTWSARPHLQ